MHFKIKAWLWNLPSVACMHKGYYTVIWIMFAWAKTFKYIYIDNQKLPRASGQFTRTCRFFPHRIVIKQKFLDKNVKYMTITWITKLSVKIILPLKALRFYMSPKQFDYCVLTYLNKFTQITTVPLLTRFQIICLVWGEGHNNRKYDNSCK